eukprot:PhF_6_TR41351/c0_g1_i1/m.62774
MAYRDMDGRESIISAAFGRRSCGTSQSISTQAALLRDSLCGECEEAVATWDCQDCQENYCDECLTAVHNRGRRKEHAQFVPIHLCSQCARTAATKECKDCQSFYCETCCVGVHMTGKLKEHKYIRPITSTNLSTEDPNMSNGMGIIVSKLTFQRNPTPERMSLFAWCEVIVEASRQSGKKFIDAEPMTLDFPADPSCIPPGIMASLSKGDQEVARQWLRQLIKTRALHKEYLIPLLDQVFSWRRLSKLFNECILFDRGNLLLQMKPHDTPRRETEIHSLITLGESSIFDVRWVNLALCMLGMNRLTMMNLFVSAEFMDVGLFALQFYREPNDLLGRPSGWNLVVIDDNIPCDSANQPVFGQTDGRGEIWAMLALKGYSKFLGALSCLHHGSTASALNHMSEAKCSIITWPQRGKNDAATVIWWIASEATRLGLMLALFPQRAAQKLSSTVWVPVESVPDELWEKGDVILQTAALTPAEAQELGAQREDPTKGVKLFKLHTVTGEVQWEGDWSQNSPTWKKEIRERFNYKMFDDNITWMGLEDLLWHYGTMMIATKYVGGPIATLHNFEAQESTNDLISEGVQMVLTLPPGKPSLNITVYVSQPYSGEVGEAVKEVEVKLICLSGEPPLKKVKSLNGLGSEMLFAPRRAMSPEVPGSPTSMASTSSQNLLGTSFFQTTLMGAGSSYLLSVSQHWNKDAFPGLVAVFDDEVMSGGHQMNPFNKKAWFEPADHGMSSPNVMTTPAMSVLQLLPMPLQVVYL